jgi:thiamine-monophosphate kinase
MRWRVMSDPADRLDEFGDIARLFRPLTRGAPGALGLLDDAALIPEAPGFDLVITKDAIVAGVHFLADEAWDLIGARLAEVNASDLAAKGAEPFAALLAVAWPQGAGRADREGFARGLGAALARTGVALIGGDTVATPGPFVASLTLLGRVPTGRMVQRAGARPGDRLMVSGVIGEAGLGLRAARGLIDDPTGALEARYRRPRARLDLCGLIRDHASAAADVSDGLIADAGHIARASGVGLRLDLAAAPLSPAARRWLAAQPDRAAALLDLASAGDDYEIVATAASALPGFTVIGEVVTGEGLHVTCDGREVEAGPGGWRHGG